MIFNVNRPSSLGQLASMFTSNPNLTPEQVGSNLFLGNSQAYDYLQQQGRNLGIGDPIQHFSKMQLAQQMANTPSGFDMEVARQSGNFGANTLPGQLARRDQIANSLMARDTASAQQAMMAQQAGREETYQLPMPGTAPRLSPLMRQDMTARGITNPIEYLMAQRLGPNRRHVASIAGLQNAVDPQSLYDQTTFHNALRQAPLPTANIFSALTGSSLPAFIEQDKEYSKIGEKFVREAAQRGDVTWNKQGEILWREPDTVDALGKTVKGSKFIPGNPYQKSQERYINRLDPHMAEWLALARKGGAGSEAAPAAAVPQQTPEQMTAAEQAKRAAVTGDFYAPAPDLSKYMPQTKPKLREVSFAEGYRPVYNFAQMLKGLVGGQPQYAAEAPLTLDNNSLAILQTPQFKAFQRRDPEAAKAWLMRAQENRDTTYQYEVPDIAY